MRFRRAEKIPKPMKARLRTFFLNQGLTLAQAKVLVSEDNGEATAQRIADALIAWLKTRPKGPP